MLLKWSKNFEMASIWTDFSVATSYLRPTWAHLCNWWPTHSQGRDRVPFATRNSHPLMSTYYISNVKFLHILSHEGIILNKTLTKCWRDYGFEVKYFITFPITRLNLSFLSIILKRLQSVTQLQTYVHISIFCFKSTTIYFYI